GGPAARLDGAGCPNPSGHVDLRVRGGTPGESALLFVGPQQTFVPLPGGCTLLAGAPLLLAGPLPLVTQGLDSGGLLLHAPLPPTVVAATAYVQAFVTSSALPWGTTSTNGLRITTSAIP